MSLTQFAMVEELAFLVKDNLPCKHLVLTMEEAFMNFLQDDPSSNEVLELEPMNAYNRLLLHRLADIFGFSHQSVGEGDERHLILERCPETSIPPVLVSDLLWQYDDIQPVSSPQQLLRRTNDSPVLKTERSTVQFSLEEREAAYLAARERIFTRYDGGANEHNMQKPRNIPVVAHRMIAHALGRKINPSNQAVSIEETKEYADQTDGVNSQERDQGSTNLIVETFQEDSAPSGRNLKLHHKPKVRTFDNSSSSHSEKKIQPRSSGRTSKDAAIPSARMQSERRQTGVYKNNLKEEHMGAAKRMFTHALAFHTVKDGSLTSEVKKTNKP